MNYLDLLKKCHLCSKQSAVFALNIHEVEIHRDYNPVSCFEGFRDNIVKGVIYPLCVDCASETDYLLSLTVVPFGKDVINWDEVRIKQVESAL